MEFIKFQSLENLYNANRVVGTIESAGKADESFIVTEKVHGANFALYSNGEDFKCANRNSFLEDAEKFYGWKSIKEKYKEKVKSFVNASLNLNLLRIFEVEGKPYLIIFGELFGGNVQKNMPYPLEKDFIAFDAVAVFDVTERNKFFLDSQDVPFYKHQELNKFVVLVKDKMVLFKDLNKHDIKTVPVLFEGNLKDCLSYDINFESKLLDETALKFKGYLDKESESYKTVVMTEGVVIEHRHPTLYGQMRPYIKNKTEKFEEKKREPKQVLTQDQKIEKLEFAEKDALTHLLALVTESRLEAVISKIGEVTIKDFGVVQKAFCSDIYEDFEKDCDNFSYQNNGALQYGVVKFKDFPNSNIIYKIVSNESSNLIRSHLLGRNVNG